MEARDVVAMLTWINQVDPRVMLNEASVETWTYAMRTTHSSEAKNAVLEHYRTNENQTVTPGIVYKRVQTAKGSAEASARALEPPTPPTKHPMSYRQRNPEEWDRLYKAGAEKRQANLQTMGLI